MVSRLGLTAALVFAASAVQGLDTAEEALRLAVPEQLMSFATLEVAGKENVAPGNDGGLTLQITPDQGRVAGGERAELTVDFPFEPGETVIYKWRFRLPMDFVTDAPENRFIIIGQWHDQPDTRLGETWETFPSRSPPIALYLGGIGNEVGFVFDYGATDGTARRSKSEPVFFERGRWHDVEAIINWSRDGSGSAILVLNGSTVARMSGANMNNNAPHYLKLGLYRHPDIEGPGAITIKDVRISK